MFEDSSNEAIEAKAKKAKRAKAAKKKAKAVKAVKTVKTVKKAKVVKTAAKLKAKPTKKVATKKEKAEKPVAKKTKKAATKRTITRNINNAVDKKLAMAAKECGGVGALADAAGYSQSAVTRVMYGDFTASHKLACAIEDATKNLKFKVTYKNLRGVKRPKE